MNRAASVEAALHPDALLDRPATYFWITNRSVWIALPAAMLTRYMPVLTQPFISGKGERIAHSFAKRTTRRSPPASTTIRYAPVGSLATSSVVRCTCA
jgi:hypothetical protein